MRRPLIRVIGATDGGTVFRHPLALSEVKSHLRVLSDAEDALIGGLMYAALQFLEGADGRGGVTGRSLVRRTYEAAFEGFPFSDRFELPVPPLEEVVALQYVDTSGGVQTFAAENYEVVTESLFGVVVLKNGRSWPPVTPGPRAVRVRFIAGYADFPRDLRAALLLHIGHLHANRESVSEKGSQIVPHAYDALVAPYNVHGWI